MNKDTHFGFEKVSTDEKQEKVNSVFTSVAENYDLMNDVMSFGLHRFWKKIMIELAGVKPDSKLLDLAGGTADIAKEIHLNFPDGGSTDPTRMRNPRWACARARLDIFDVLRRGARARSGVIGRCYVTPERQETDAKEPLV